MAKRWSDVKAAMPADLRRRIEKGSAELNEQIKTNSVLMSLADLRANRDVTQVDVAAGLGINQGAVSKIEGRDDVHVSTLARYVEALGGRLELRAVFPEGSIVVDGLLPAARARIKAPGRGSRTRLRKTG